MYRCAIVLRSSPTPTVMRFHPLGIAQVPCVALAASARVCVGTDVGMSCVGKAEANSTANVVGKGDGVGGKDGADVSVNESETPPITSKREMAPMMNPLPNWRRAFIFISPFPVYSMRWEAEH